MGRSRTVTIHDRSQFKVDRVHVSGTYVVQELGFTKPSGKSAIGHPVETWRKPEQLIDFEVVPTMVLHVIHSHEPKQRPTSIAFWISDEDERWRFTILEAMGPSEYMHIQPNDSWRKHAKQIWELTMEVVGREVNSAILST